MIWGYVAGVFTVALGGYIYIVRLFMKEWHK